jgi:2,5-diketo-D-gluconate reductase A
VPAVNQIELHPGFAQDELRAFHERHGIVTESWSPLGGPGSSVLASPALAALGHKYEKSPAQIVLRWHVQNGLVAIPKSSTPARMAENLAVFDFALDADDLAVLASLSRGPDAGVDSDRSGH